MHGEPADTRRNGGRADRRNGRDAGCDDDSTDPQPPPRAGDDRERGDHGDADRQGQRQARPVVHEDRSEVEVHLVSARRRNHRLRITEGAREGECVRPVVLHRRRRRVGHRVGPLVVPLEPVDVREVHRRQARLDRHREVAVVRHAPVDLLRQRGREDVRHRARHGVDEPGGPLARLEHDDRPAIAARFEVEHQPDVARHRALGEERARAHQPVLLSLGEEEDDVVPQRLRCGERPRRLEQGDHAEPVVRSTWRELARVVVRHEHQGRSARRPRTTGDDVAHMRRDDRRAEARRVQVGERRRVLHFHGEVERPELRGDHLARTSSLALVPVGWGLAASRRSCSIARSAENSVGGAVAGRGVGSFGQANASTSATTAATAATTR